MKKGIKRFVASLSEKTELPLAEMCREYSTYVAGRREITVDGVMSICKYETESVVLEVCGGYIFINGKGLILKNFYQTTLCIGGKISSVEFEENVSL